VRDFLKQKEGDILKTIKDEGVTVTEPDREAFKEATKNVREAVEEQVPSELVEKIENQK
jgi:TRAP-type C4-dicarboxylate transport system substrate-binding protein